MDVNITLKLEQGKGPSEISFHKSEVNNVNDLLKLFERVLSTTERKQVDKIGVIFDDGTTTWSGI